MQNEQIEIKSVPFPVPGVHHCGMQLHFKETT